MLSGIVAHSGPIGPSDAWSAWNWNPMIWSMVAALVALHEHGRRGRVVRDRARRRAFLGAVAALAVALVSPLDAASGSLASAHMVQHLVIVLVAAPLFVVARPTGLLVRGLPVAVRRQVRRARRTDLAHRFGRIAEDPVAMAVLHTVTVWFWHTDAAYDGALDHDLLHALEHVSFLATAMLSWSAIIARRRSRRHDGAGVLVLFALSVQSGVLGALLTFARRPLYESYATTTAAWNLDPLQDQQLAGVIMWVPGGAAYLVVALVVLHSWISEPEARPTPSPAWKMD